MAAKSPVTSGHARIETAWHRALMCGCFTLALCVVVIAALTWLLWMPRP